MRRTLLVCLAVLAVLLGSVAPARAVTDGYPDDGTYNNVGLVVFTDAAGTPTHRCSGTMLSATLFLTAGHCTSGAAGARVYFDQTIDRVATGYPFSGGITGRPVTMAGFDDFATFPNTSDLGYVVLHAPAPVSTYATLAGIGTLDAMATKRGQQETRFTVSGYGLQQVRPVTEANLTRLVAEVRLINLSNSLTDGFNLHHTNAPGTGGGTCFGDSGGPVFLAGTQTVVGVTSFGLSQNCGGNGFAYRVDTQAAQDFIATGYAAPARGRGRG